MNVSARVAAKIYDANIEQTNVGIVVGSADGIAIVPLERFTVPPKEEDLKPLFSNSQVEIDFLRINQGYFEMSFEKSAFVFSTPIVMIDEISLFLQETAHVGNRGANYNRLVTSLLIPKSKN